MTANAHLRGHPIYWDSGNEIWRYSDTSEPTVENHKDRLCGHCGEHNTPEGHDACLGTLPDVMNACCGHGEEWLAYVQFWDGSIVDGAAATRVIRERQNRRPNTAS